jgi:hypothetical protein
MPSIRDVYGSGNTLSAADLPVGVQVPVVIEAVRAVRFDDGNKLEIRFRGKQKVLMANKTNAMRIADQHGDDYDTWPGKVIFLQHDKTEFKGQLVDCVRVVREPIVTPASRFQPLEPAQPISRGVSAAQGQSARTHYRDNSDDIPF